VEKGGRVQGKRAPLNSVLAGPGEEDGVSTIKDPLTIALQDMLCTAMDKPQQPTEHSILMLQCRRSAALRLVSGPPGTQRKAPQA
jgi:hypothetical protein